MKKLLLTLGLLALGATRAHAGLYYDNTLSASSATLRLAGILRVNDPAAPYTNVITLNGANGTVTATTLSGSLNGSNLVAGSVDTTKVGSGAVGQSQLNDNAVTLTKIAANGCSANQILKRNAGNTAWACAADDTASTSFSSQVTFDVSLTTSAIFKGFSYDVGSNAAHGQIMLGGTHSTALRISHNAANAYSRFTNMYDSTSAAIFLCTRGDTANEHCPLKVDQNAGAQSVYIGEGTNVIYYCDAGASAGNLCRGSGCSCSGGTWVDTGLRLK